MVQDVQNVIRNSCANGSYSCKVGSKVTKTVSVDWKRVGAMYIIYKDTTTW